MGENQDLDFDFNFTGNKNNANIRTHIEPFRFNINKRYYNIDLVYRVLAIDDESGAGKTLFIRDLLDSRTQDIKDKDTQEKFMIAYFNGHTQSEVLYKYVKNTDLTNTFVIIDDIEYIDPDELLKGILKTKNNNTQWLLLGHGNFVGISSMDAIRRMHVKTTGQKKEISFIY